MMKTRGLFLTVVVLTALGGGVALYATRAAAPPPAAKLETSLTPDNDLWPILKSWVWTVDPIGTKRKATVCVRTTSAPIKPNEEPSIPAAEPLPTQGEDKRTGWSVFDRHPTTARVTCQLIDLREAGIGDPKEPRPLRLLVRFRGGAMNGITGQRAILPGTEWYGIGVDGEPQWVGDTLRLMTVRTRTADTVFAHHVFVEQSDAN